MLVTVEKNQSLKINQWKAKWKIYKLEIKNKSIESEEQKDKEWVQLIYVEA
jgi:hypothetical protein